MDEKSTQKKGVAVMELAMEMALTDDILDKIAAKHGPRMACDAAMSTSVGGIGPLLRERVIAQAEKGVNVVGVSLLYETVWRQGLHNWNHLFLERRTVGDAIRSVLTDTGITLTLALYDKTQVTVKVWKTAYGEAPVYFLDCPDIANVVYPCQEDSPEKTPDPTWWADQQRLKQSWLVGRGALALAKTLNFKPDVIVLSETPTLFVHHRLIKDEFQKDPLFDGTRYIFNDHTPLEYAHPIWPIHTLRQLNMDPEIYSPFLAGSGDHAHVDITRLLVATAEGVFGVAKKHGVVMRAMPSLKDYASKINSITNGVSEAIWQNKVFSFADKLSDADLLAAKEKLKESFIGWLWRRAGLWPVWVRVARKKAFLLWTRRITSYKRLDILQRVLLDPQMRKRFLATDIVLIVGGRIYQRDNVSEKMVYGLVELLNEDQELGDRIIFLDNYNVWEAPKLFHAADGAIMLADDGREASATGFMKAQMNGGLIIANSDGAVPEFVHFLDQSPADKTNGFGVSYVNGQPDPGSFMAALENFDAVYKNPNRRAAMMRSALVVTPQVSVRRTVDDTIAFYNQVIAGGRKVPATK
ncbi:MAG TPA: glycogen/starch/alpha-glucan phosphorylase [Elusimicrobiota bacterium]|nr:glycogen/starch/alpha-glucan phosphorylase [Elusimicrobiota bacterium]